MGAEPDLEFSSRRESADLRKSLLRGDTPRSEPDRRLVLRETQADCLANVLHLRETAVSKSQSGLLRDDFWMRPNVSIGEALVRRHNELGLDQ